MRPIKENEVLKTTVSGAKQAAGDCSGCLKGLFVKLPLTLLQPVWITKRPSVVEKELQKDGVESPCPKQILRKMEDYEGLAWYRAVASYALVIFGYTIDLGKDGGPSVPPLLAALAVYTTLDTVLKHWSNSGYAKEHITEEKDTTS
jgi:hypothetical protein